MYVYLFPVCQSFCPCTYEFVLSFVFIYICLSIYFLSQDFANAGASYITFHPEASNHVDRSLQLIKGRHIKIF